MLNSGNIEKINIPGAFEWNAPARMYVIGYDDAFSTKVQDEIIDCFNPERYAAPFSFELLNSADSIPNKAIAKVVKHQDYLAIIQILDAEEPTFMACRKLSDAVQDCLSIINLMYVAEQKFKSSLSDVILNYAQDKPAKLKELLQTVAEAIVYATTAPGMMMATPSIASRSISFCGRAKSKDKNPKISPEVLEAARKDFPENVRKYQSGDENALPYIEMVINAMSASEKTKILSDYIKTLAEDEVNSLHKRYIYTNNILAKSKVSVWVRHFNDCISNSGYFRILCQYCDEEPVPFHFKSKESCVVFLMHLLYNRQNGDMRKNLILDERNQNAFVHIFHKVYDIKESEIISKYINLQDSYDSESNKQLAQGRLKDFISDCNRCVNEFTLPLGESPYPLNIKRNGHMPILNSKVHFDEASLRELQTTIV